MCIIEYIIYSIFYMYSMLYLFSPCILLYLYSVSICSLLPYKLLEYKVSHELHTALFLLSSFSTTLGLTFS